MSKNVVSIRQPKTLMQAHEKLVRLRPDRDASPSAWLAYYRHSVAVYEQIAKDDSCHDAEAILGTTRTSPCPASRGTDCCGEAKQVTASDTPSNLERRRAVMQERRCWDALIEQLQGLWSGLRQCHGTRRARLTWQTCRRCRSTSYLQARHGWLCKRCRSLQ